MVQSPHCRKALLQAGRGLGCCMSVCALRIRRILSFFLVLVLLFALSSCRKTPPDPHEGMVEVSNGMGGTMWVRLHENLPASDLLGEEFVPAGSFLNYAGTAYSALRGIDVSEHQGEIDWQAVRADGVDFAILRAGYRGYSQGQLFEDAYFRANLEGARAAGLRLGVYFFSQAVSVEEAREEADFLLGLLEGLSLELPVFYDWEQVAGVGETRTDELDSGVLTDGCLTFCETIRNAGYEPGVYFYRSLAYYEYELDRLSGLVFWVGAPGETPDFYYAHTIWQYSFTGEVQGIGQPTDLNLWFQAAAESA